MLHPHSDTDPGDEHSQSDTNSEDKHSLMDYQCTPIPTLSPPHNMEDTINCQHHTQEVQGHAPYHFQDHQRSSTIPQAVKKPTAEDCQM